MTDWNQLHCSVNVQGLLGWDWRWTWRTSD